MNEFISTHPSPLQGGEPKSHQLTDIGLRPPAGGSDFGLQIFQKIFFLFWQFKFLTIFVTMNATMFYIWSWRGTTTVAVIQAII